MKIGIVGDIHANYEALAVVLNALEERGCVRIVCVGDVVGYGPDPSLCVRAVREKNILAIQGNHDAWSADDRVHWEASGELQEIISWNRRVLSDEEKEWLGTLPKHCTYAGLDFVHATNESNRPWRYVRSEAELARNFKYQKRRVCFHGHTHVPAIGILNSDAGETASFVPVEESFQLTPGSYAFINPGAVGQPRDGDQRAAFAVYEIRNRTVEFQRKAYDVRQTQKKMAEQGIPRHYIERLATGA